MENNIDGIKNFIRDNYGRSSAIITTKEMAGKIGLEVSILLSDLIGKDKYFESRGELNKDGYFFNTTKNIRRDTILSKHKQARAINALKRLGFIEVVRGGLHARLWFKINYRKINEFYINEILKKPEKTYTTSEESGKYLLKNRNDYIYNKPNIIKSRDLEVKDKSFTSTEMPQKRISVGLKRTSPKNKSTSLVLNNKLIVAPEKEISLALDKEEPIALGTSIKDILERSKRGIVLKDAPAPMKEVNMPFYVEPFVKYWQEKGLRSFRGTNTKTYKNAIKALKKINKGTAFNRSEAYKDKQDKVFSLADWKKSVDNLKRLIDDTDLWYGKDKSFLKRLDISEFILNSRTGKSMFLYCLKNSLVEGSRFTFPEPWEKDLPGLTEKFMQLYQIDTGNTPKISEKNHFIRALDFIFTQFENKETTLPFPLDKIRFFLEVLKDGFKDPFMIKPRHVDTDLTFQRFKKSVNDTGVTWKIRRSM